MSQIIVILCIIIGMCVSCEGRESDDTISAITMKEKTGNVQSDKVMFLSVSKYNLPIQADTRLLLDVRELSAVSNFVPDNRKSFKLMKKIRRRKSNLPLLNKTYQSQSKNALTRDDSVDVLSIAKKNQNDIKAAVKNDPVDNFSLSMKDSAPEDKIRFTSAGEESVESLTFETILDHRTSTEADEDRTVNYITSDAVEAVNHISTEAIELQMDSPFSKRPPSDQSINRTETELEIVGLETQALNIEKPQNDEAVNMNVEAQRSNTNQFTSRVGSLQDDPTLDTPFEFITDRHMLSTQVIGLEKEGPISEIFPEDETLSTTVESSTVTEEFTTEYIGLETEGLITEISLEIRAISTKPESSQASEIATEGFEIETEGPRTKLSPENGAISRKAKSIPATEFTTEVIGLETEGSITELSQDKTILPGTVESSTFTTEFTEGIGQEMFSFDNDSPHNSETGLSTQKTNVEDDVKTPEMTLTVGNATTVTLQTNEKIVIALLELDSLRQEKQDMEEEIEEMLNTIGKLIDIEESEERNRTVIGDLDDKSKHIENVLTKMKTRGQKLRKGKKILPKNGKVSIIKTAFGLFSNLQTQLQTLLENRHKFLVDISDTISRELGLIRQGLEFFQRLIDFKLDQSALLLGDMNPILNILQSGSTSVFLVITHFFDAVSSVLAMKGQFLRAFSGNSSGGKEAGLLERIQRLKLNQVLPNKLKLLLRVHANSGELADIIQEIFRCVSDLSDAKIALIQSVGQFVDRKVEFLSGLTGPSTSVGSIVEGVRSGNLHQLLNFGPLDVRGIPFVSDQQLMETVNMLISGIDPMVPIIGPVKPIFVNQKVLGMLAGPAKERVVNLYLSRKLSQFLDEGRYHIRVSQGEALFKTWLPPVELGTKCDTEVSIGRSYASIVVNRNSRFTATKGLSLHSHRSPSLDLFGQARAYVDINIQGKVKASVGREMFGNCLPKFSVDSPLKMRGKGIGDVFAKVSVYSVRLETRATQNYPIIGKFLPNITAGIQKPHLVFKFNIKVDGTVAKFDISSLKLSGCRFSFLGIKMFSHCDLVENLVRKQIQDFTRRTFPLKDSDLIRQIEKAIRMRVGEEISIPLSLSDTDNLAPVNTVISKTQSLIRLSTKLGKRVLSFTQDMTIANTTSQQTK